MSTGTFSATEQPMLICGRGVFDGEIPQEKGRAVPRRKKPTDEVPHPYMGANLRWWREHQGLGVRELARKAGVSPGYISQLESSEKIMTYGMCCLIASVLRINPEQLWDHRPPPSHKPEPRIGHR